MQVQGLGLNPDLPLMQVGSKQGSAADSGHLELVGRFPLASLERAGGPGGGVSASSTQRASCVTLLSHPLAQLAVSAPDGSIGLYSLQRQQGTDEASHVAAGGCLPALVASVYCAEPAADAASIGKRSGGSHQSLSSVGTTSMAAAGTQQGAHVAQSGCSRFLAACRGGELCC